MTKEREGEGGGSPFSALTLLIVDDDDAYRRLLARQLGVVCPRILEVRDGHEALELVETHRVDAVLQDIVMPRLSGFDVMRRLRERGHDIPVIVVTAYATREHLLEALRLGALDFLEKPVRVEAARAAAVRALELGRLIRHLAAEIEGTYDRPDAPPGRRAYIRELRRRIAALRAEAVEAAP